MKAFEAFGKYILLERLAAGGMAEVYLAKSTGAGGVAKFLAIKRILPQYSENPEFIEMFKEEAKIAVNLNHSNVVSIFDFGVVNKQFFLAMEYVEGQNLRQILNHLKKEGKDFSIDQVVYVIKQVAAGLDHAHRCIDPNTGRPLNITHRDMSPQNIMISFEGEVKVVDFGIAKAESQLENTKAGTIKGKFGYMSPEQTEGIEVDLRTDIFSLGTVLWELLAKERLFSAGSEAATLRKIRDCQIPSLRRINPAIPPELERICNKSLAKDKSLRYQSSAALHKDLNRFLNTQYPEFSAHEFSIFMKSAFSLMFIENRKKHVDYAKLGSSTQDDKTIYTSAGTSTSSTSTDIANFKKNVIFNANINTGQDAVGLASANYSTEHELKLDISNKGYVNLNELKTKENPIDKASIFQNKHKQEFTGSYARGLSPTLILQKRKRYVKIATTIIMMALMYFTYWSFENIPEVKTSLHSVLISVISMARKELAFQTDSVATNPSTEPVQTDASSTSEFASQQSYTVTIESTPPGARLYLNGKDTGMITPVRRKIEGDKEVRVGLIKEGYIYYEKVEKIINDASTLTATLQALPPMGYVSINVINGGSNPVIFINDQRINQKPPIRLYGVAANTPVKIRASNPFARLSAESTVSVGASEKKEVNLILSREANK